MQRQAEAAVLRAKQSAAAAQRVQLSKLQTQHSARAQLGAVLAEHNQPSSSKAGQLTYRQRQKQRAEFLERKAARATRSMLQQLLRQ